MKHKVRLLSSSQEFEVNEDETILSAALRSGIPYPYSCQAGRCGACKSRVSTGEVEHLSHLRFTLTEQEKSEGIILACRAKPKSALELSWLGGSDQEFLPKNFEAEVIKKESLTHDTYRIFAQVLNADLTFHPGQFAMLQFAGFQARSYSMANQPGDKTLEFFIRRVPQGIVSSYVADSLKVGERISIQGPFGQSYLRKEHTGPILAVAGGSGLSAIKSIIDGALLTSMKQKISLYIGARTQSDLYLTDYFVELDARYPHFTAHFAVDAGLNAACIRSGRVGDAVLSDWPGFSGDWRAYLAGPPPMVEGLVPALIERGMSESAIHSDPFYYSQDAKAQAAATPPMIQIVKGT